MHTPCACAVFLLLLWGVFPGIWALKIGCLVSWTGWAVGSTITGAADIAVKEINNAGLLGEERLEIFHGDPGCYPATAVSVLLDLKEKHGMDAIVGPGCSTSCEATNYVARYYNLPQISWGCASSTLSNKEVFTTFTRMVTPYNKLGPVFNKIFLEYGWAHCAILHSTESIWSAAGQDLASTLPELGIQVLRRFSFEPGVVLGIPGRKAQFLQSILESRVRIIIRDIMLTARELGMTGAGWQYVGATLEWDFLKGEIDWMGDDGRDDEAFAAADGTISIFTAISTTKQFKTLEDQIREVMMRDYNVSSSELETLNSSAGYLYDAIYLYARAVVAAKEAGVDYRNGTALRIVQIDDVSFDGITGRVDLDESGDNLQSFDVGNFRFDDPSNRGLRIVGTYNFDKDAYVLNGEQIIFPGGLTEPPISLPPPEEFDRSPILEWLFFSLAVLGIVVTVVVAAVLAAYRTHTVVAYAQPEFLVGMLAGILLGFSYVILVSFTPSTGLCVAQLWVGHFSFLCTFAPLVAKSMRIAFLFDSARGFQKVNIPIWRVWAAVALLAIPVAAYLAVWTALDTYTTEVIETNDAGTAIYWKCDSHRAWWKWVIFGCEGAALLTGLGMMFYARNIPTSYSEARFISFSMANIFLVALIAIVVITVVSDQPDVDLIIKSIAMLFGSAFIMVMVLVPKVFYIYFPEQDEWTTRESAL
eukprot:CAMPEP_0177633018 /NCGR_PEP_ID=MMETSP0447-20121125/2611_1 /TAXON_ID=0 /ORGANISM="Stygamoeba regulata, Strain BSH-02190019" /LENGTH=700 /DNA_ID=CAMNT_0019134645 /DNA_START=138 /DNA_END=2237 /DNA_ORIENTATION=-